MEAPIIGIQRHRMATDGNGVTTLVGFWGCPLQCKYCLNPQSWKINKAKTYSVQQLFSEVAIDQLYFLATGGGVTFGGGEPLLYATFIKEFRELCGPEWNITVETSLNVPISKVEAILPIANHYIVDIKETNNDIYQSYTGKSNQQVLENLKWLVSQKGSDAITVRIPLIPNYNKKEDQTRSVKQLKQIGITKFDLFNYQTDINKL